MSTSLWNLGLLLIFLSVKSERRARKKEEGGHSREVKRDGAGTCKAPNHETPAKRRTLSAWNGRAKIKKARSARRPLEDLFPRLQQQRQSPFS